MPKYLILHGTVEDGDPCQVDTLEEVDEVAPDGCYEDATLMAQDLDGEQTSICAYHAEVMREQGLAAQAM